MKYIFFWALSAISVCAFLTAAPPYVIDTLKGKTKPERATWFIWSVLGVIAFVAQFRLGATLSLLFTGLDAFGSISVFLLSLHYGVGGWTKLDKIALAVAGFGVFAALLGRKPLFAIIGVLLADASGSILTIRKAFFMPDTETTISWWLVSVGALCSVLLVRSWDISLLLYPTYLFVVNGSVPCSQALGRWRAKHQIG